MQCHADRVCGVRIAFKTTPAASSAPRVALGKIVSACGVARLAYDMTRIACSGARISLNEAPAAHDDLPATIRETQTAGSEAPTASILPRFASVKIVQACSVTRPACMQRGSRAAVFGPR
ncbi:MAG TPA: hypothetical protein VF756_22610 [Thermoanaerobaculia bacterium]